MSVKQDAKTYPVRISGTMLAHLMGTQLWASQGAGKHPRRNDSAAAIRMIRKVREQRPRRSDGSVKVELTRAEVLELKDYAEGLRASCLGSSDRELLGDYNAANGMLRRIDKGLGE